MSQLLRPGFFPFVSARGLLMLAAWISESKQKHFCRVLKYLVLGGNNTYLLNILYFLWKALPIILALLVMMISSYVVFIFFCQS